MTDLLPCPFCGGTDVSVILDPTGDFTAHCWTCGTYGPWVDCNDNRFGGDEELLATEGARLWNRRAPSLFGKPITFNDDLPDVGKIVLG